MQCIKYFLALYSQHLDAYTEEKNELLLNMLRLVKLLVAHGYYSEPDSVRQVISLLIDIIGMQFLYLHVTHASSSAHDSLNYTQPSLTLDADPVADYAAKLPAVIFSVKAE